MGKSRIMIFVESVVDGTIGIEQVWQTYGDEIRSTSNLSTEEDMHFGLPWILNKVIK